MSLLWGGGGVKEPDHRHHRLLCARRNRPRRRAAEPPSSVMSLRRFMSSIGGLSPLRAISAADRTRFFGTTACHSEAGKSLGQT
jgi:hypothetical protein